MSGHGPYPPPGQPPPPPPGPPPGWTSPPPAYPSPLPYAGQPGNPAYPQTGYAQPGYPYMLPAAHKPGAIPLRPLGLSDIYDGAFKIIRYNPKATVGSAVLVTAVAMMLPVLVSSVLAFVLDPSSAGTSLDSGDMPADGTGFLLSYGSIAVGSVLQTFGLVFVTGMIAHVTAAAAVGQKLTLGAAWAATRGKRWRLVALWLLLLAATAVYAGVTVGIIALLAVLLGNWVSVLLSVGLALIAGCGLVYLWVRVYYLAVPGLMLEPIGLFGALGRSFALTSRQFWRTFGIALLTVVITQIVGGILGVPFSIVGMIGVFAAGGGPASIVILAISNAVSAVVTAAFVAPFTGAVASLQYVDQRIRKEGYDVELMTRAGLVRR